MKKSLLKKFLYPTITLASCAAIVAPLTSCSTNAVVVDDDHATTIEQLKAETTTVKFSQTAGVTIEGATTIKVKKGTVWAQVKQPKATKGGLKFKYWSLEEDGDAISWDYRITDATTVYPIFEDKLLLSNCIGISVIESTELSFAWTGTATPESINIQYSDNYGEDWTTVGTSSKYELKPGDNVFLRGLNDPNPEVEEDEHFSFGENNYASIKFSEEGAVNIAGNVMGLIDGASGTIDQIPNNYCFYHLFENNKALKYVSDDFLPATELTPSCYEGMFYGCTSLVMAPNLPATVIAPTPATANAEYQDNCYKELFYGCSSLKYIKLAFTENFNTCFDDWVNGVSGSGEFVYAGTDTTQGVDAIPTGWKIEQKTTSIAIKCVDQMYLIDEHQDQYKFTLNHPYQFKADIQPASASQTLVWHSDNTSIASINPDNGILTGIAPGTCHIKAISTDGSHIESPEYKIEVKEIDLKKTLIVSAGAERSSVAYNYIGAGVVPQMKYSYNGVDWMKLWPGVPAKIYANSSVYIKGDNIEGLTVDGVADVSHTHFTFGTLNDTETGTWYGNVNLSGSVMGLMDDGRNELKQMGYKVEKDPVTEEETVVEDDYCLAQLFSGGNKVINIIEKDSQGNAIPFLPCTNLSAGCYDSMFSSCTELKNAPALPATDLTDCDSCYGSMFYNCQKIGAVPALNATSLADKCYQAMFYDCHSLKTAPALPAVTAFESCYQMMFQYCYQITSVREVGLKTFADTCCFQMYSLWKDSEHRSTIIFQNSSSWFATKIISFPENCFADLTDPVLRMFDGDTPSDKSTWYYR